MTIDLAHLRSLCEAATPGPWSVGEDDSECAATLRASPVISGQSVPCGPPIDVIIPFGRAYSDAAFIAAANPAAVLELIAEIERLTTSLAHAASENMAFNVKVAGEINEARAQRDAWRRRAQQHGCNIADGDPDCG